MDAIIKDVNDGWDEDERRTQFKGSDDYLRQKVREMVTWVVLNVDFLTVRGIYIWCPCVYQACRFHFQG